MFTFVVVKYNLNSSCMILVYNNINTYNKLSNQIWHAALSA